MKNALLVLAGACALTASFQVFAQGCGTNPATDPAPLTITSEGGPADTVSGNLCSSGNYLSGMGGTPSPGNDIVYSFVAHGANATIDFTQGSESTWGGNQGAVFLMSACNTATDPSAFGFVGTPMPVSGLTDGATDYVVVTSDPAAPPATCGSFTAKVTGTLPVALQSFTVG